eukprot:CAMPEP_0174236630 /NCGR_PEP_ID=MMETSP0417-20130205/5704_1 /TAXON_ID=242541 /ORGANISM="Mayorella sp, Strain BSH-02190019" /LENGTH=290 /DNA_ID=CAMNT_0015315301 /DNA_START=486 /DNA_END=1354 /DNA_ORIENTATION=+
MNAVVSGSSPSCGPARFSAGVCIAPHPDKLSKGGEDSFFIAERGHVVGVVDGVGGWAEIGVDPALYAKSWTSVASRLVDHGSLTAAEDVLIQTTFKTNKTRIQGSCTAVVASLHTAEDDQISVPIEPGASASESDAILQVANLGDSGLLVARPNHLGVYEKLYRSVEQTHGFNHPYQAGSRGDDPTLADVYAFPVQSGDCLVVGTDGLFDNLYDEEILEVLNENYVAEPGLPKPVCHTGGDPSSAEVASRIVARAYASSTEVDGQDRPFAVSAREHCYLYYGGKMDDILV